MTDPAGAEDPDTSLLRLLQEIAARPRLTDVFELLVLRLGELFPVRSVSVVLPKPEHDVAFVVASAQAGGLQNLVIRLHDYPELAKVLQTREPLVIADMFEDDLLAGVRGRLEAAKVQHRGAYLFPLVYNGEAIGVLFLRSKQPLEEPSASLLAKGSLVAAVTAVAVGSGLEHENLEREWRDLQRSKAEVDEELRGLRQFFAFLDHAHDGVLLTNLDGEIRYSNASSAKVLRRTSEELHGAPLVSLLAQRSRVLAERALRGDAIADPSGYLDLVVVAPSGEEIVLSASLQRSRQPEGVFVSFRNVTELREIESELRQTKEFLENLIQSSADAIIAADVDGHIILFNRSAEQILGYSARDVVGRLSMGNLYPEGELREVMRRCRSESHGGKGRLLLMRTELVARDGEAVPVNLSASIIYEGDTEIATVSIFSDLRERRRMEEKLSQVQRRLQISERQAIAIELAGTAAHELNQPLTSILGYAAMLQRREQATPLEAKAVTTIYREAERMAGIVRRLGQITAYETKPYVGQSQIIDLGKTTEGETE